MESEWFKDWFNTPYYHILYKNRDDNEAHAFIDRLIGFLKPETNNKFLDVACGKGRHSIYLNNKGFDVTGIDISPQSIAEAKTHENPTLHFFVADMREHCANNEYDIALNLFTSFGYFEDRNDNLRALQNIYTAIKPGGRFVLDYFNATKVLANLELHTVKVIDGIEFIIDKQVFDGRIIKNISFVVDGERHTFKEKVEAKDKNQFEALFTKAGFEVETVFGDYLLGAFDEQLSDRLIFVVKKPA
jgi:SAM-dependent methyltransferase